MTAAVGDIVKMSQWKPTELRDRMRAEFKKLEVATGDRPLRVPCDVCGEMMVVPLKSLNRAACVDLLLGTDIVIGGKEAVGALRELVRDALIGGSLSDETSLQKLRRATKIPKRCDHHYVCQGFGGPCGKRVNADAYTARRIAVRKRLPPMCRACVARKARTSLTPEQRSESGRKGQALLMVATTPEQRSETMRKSRAAMTPEQRSESARKGNAAKPPGQLSEARRKWLAALTPEQRSESMRKARVANAARTPEQRSETIRKAWATRRANRDSGEAP